MKAQDKLNRIDIMLSKYGFKMAGTVEKLEALIKEHKKYKDSSVYLEYRMRDAIHLLEHGYVE